MVRNLVLLWDLYMNTNHTGVDASNMTDWKEFLEEERDFVESFDFLKDLAIDNPGLYFVHKFGPVKSCRYYIFYKVSDICQLVTYNMG